MKQSLAERYLEPFPVMLFAVVMGLAGLVVVYEKASFLFGVPDILWMGLMALTVLVFTVVSVSYALKVAHFPEAVLAEARHPVKSSFLSTIPISLLLVSITLFNEVNPFLAFALWWVGVIGQLAGLLYVFPRWIRNAHRIEHLNPAWFIPIVGTILIPVVGVDAGSNFINLFFFSVGMFLWVVFLPIIIYRLIFHDPPAERFLPTLFILIAPPAVGLIAYFRITSVLDMAGYMLYSLALFFALVLFAMARHLKPSRFYISWWAYTFPLDALTIASMLIFEVTREPLFRILSIVFMLLATAVVGGVGVATVRKALAHELFEE